LANVRAFCPSAQKGKRYSSCVAKDKQELRVLEPGRPIQRELAKGEKHSYQITLASGQYIHLVVDQRGVDVVVTLFGPKGQQLGTVNRPFNGTQGWEPVSLVTETPGVYRLKIIALEKEVGPGLYEVTIKDLREATPQDRIRVAAEMAFLYGEQRHVQGTEDSIREGIKKYEEALSGYQATEDYYWQAEALNNMGGAYYNLGEKRKALDYFAKALPLRQAANDRSGEAGTLNNMGVVVVELGELEQALKCYEDSLPMWRILKDRRGEGTTLNNIGRIYGSIGEIQKAFEYCWRALPLHQAVVDRYGQAATYHNMALLYLWLGNSQRALEYYYRALRLWRPNQDYRERGITLNDMGVAYASLGYKRKALQYYRWALVNREKSGDYAGKATTLHNLGVASYSVGNKQTALRYYRQAMKIWDEVNDPAGKADTLPEIGLVYRSMGERQKALDCYHQALSYNQALRNQIGEAETLYRIARVEYDRGNFTEAYRQVDDALKKIEIQRTKVASQELRSSYFATIRDYYEFAIDLLMQLHKRDPSQDYKMSALHTSERARARSLLDLIAESKVDIEKEIDPGLRKRRIAIHARIAGLQRQLMEAYSNSQPVESKIVALKEDLKKREEDQERLEMEVRQKHPRYAELRYPTPLGLQAIQGLLDERTVLLEYILGHEASYLFAVTKSDFLVAPLDSANSIPGLVQRLREALDEPSQFDRWNLIQQARQLYRMLIQPAKKLLADKRQLIIVPDGALYYLPFEALLQSGSVERLMQLESHQWPYLIRDYAISYAPSASVLANLGNRGQEAHQPPKIFLAYADPVYGKTQPHKVSPVGAALRTLDIRKLTKLQDLPESRKEVEDMKSDIVKLYGEDKVALFLGEQAIEENVKQGEMLSQFRYVHFAVHGLLNENRPEFSGLVLSLPVEKKQGARNKMTGLKRGTEPPKADQLPESGTSTEDGLLQVYEIFNLRLNADMVVLSACETGLGKQVRGEGVIGLTRAFLYAGTPSVVVSLWQVRDQSTAELMVQFYRHLVKGQRSKAEALKQAKLALIGSKDFAHPHHWAPFILVGQP
jgi:CHAT domain-containing protein/Tfp pilus assembly protein PilF